MVGSEAVVGRRFAVLGPPRLRGVAFVATLAVVAVACGSGASRSSSPASTIAFEQVTSSPTEDVPSALDNLSDRRHPAPLLDPGELRAGGPPPDGIPAIDKPRFVAAEAVDFLDDDEPVLALEIGGEARAYPVQILLWHEIVNDTVGGVPVAVTYCPLCNSAIAYDRRLGKRVLDFGTSGLLHNSALIMYDRQTESLWSHFTGEAVIGFLTGAHLELFPMATVSWSDWHEANPHGLVLSRSTGFSRDYGRNPYPGYDDVDTSPFLYDGELDGRLAAKERVIGVQVDGAAVAVLLGAVARTGTRQIDVGGHNLVVWVDPGTASALDAGSVAGGRDVGATGVFESETGGQRLSFERREGGFVDRETGSRWNVFGRAVAGPLVGSSLAAVPHVDTFWFAWAAFLPETQIVS